MDLSSLHNGVCRDRYRVDRSRGSVTAASSPRRLTFTV